jgi:hypothetical protein
MMENHKYVSDIDYDVHCDLAKFQTKVQLVYGETKMTNCMVG